MKGNIMLKHFCVFILIVLFSRQASSESFLMRFADVSESHIVFTYENDLWLVPISGGMAKRITKDPGREIFAKFSPDGSRLAFTANYDGGSDVYVMDRDGSVPERLTFHPVSDLVLDWFPDGEHILFRSQRSFSFWIYMLYKVSAEGGMPERMPVDRAGLASLSPDANSVAYNRISREFRNWKRYKGGMAQNIWVGSFDEGNFDRITTFEGTDNFPMWHGDAVYFTSDREDGTLNLYKYTFTDKKITRLTHYDDYDVKYPSLGNNHIVFQYGEKLHLFDLETESVKPVVIEIPTDQVDIRSMYIEAADHVESFGLSPNGSRAVMEIRGEIVNMPVEEGITYNITNSSGIREKNPVWSPDGGKIAFISDKTGEEELFLIEPGGLKEAKQITRGGKGFRERPVWSPDGNHMMFHDKYMKLNLVNVSTGELKTIDKGDYDDGWYNWGIQDYSWSPDSRWVAYAKLEQSMYQSIFLYSIEQDKTYRVTSSMTQDWSPAFSKDGRYLYFLSNRTFNPIMGFVDQNHIYRDLTRPYLLILKKGDPSPFRPENVSDKKHEAEAPSRADKLEIGLTDFEQRIIPAPVKAADLFRLEATENGFCYMEKTEDEFIKYQYVDDKNRDTNLDLHHFSLAAEEDKILLSGIGQYHLSADGKKMIYRAGKTIGVVDVSEAKVGDGTLNLEDIHIFIDRKKEFVQIFEEAWRVQRDWFYDPDMHGLKWEKVKDKYIRFLPYCGTRADVNYLIGEMIAELSAGHTYIYGGDLNRPERISTGYLGAEFESSEGSYPRIARIIEGINWDESDRSPFLEPACPIKEGDYILGVDGRYLNPGDNLYKYLEHKRNEVVELVYNDRPEKTGAKRYLVKTIPSNATLLYSEWVRNNARAVAEATNGDVGYVHIPNMGEAGLNSFAKAFYPQFYKKGLIIDVRYNGGGFTSKMIIDRLEREITTMDQPREGKPGPIPERAFGGHLVLLINQDTGSDGEIFSETWKQRGFGPIIGQRTWGGAVGIEAHQPLVDGAVTTPPQFADYNLKGEWTIEGIGVIPDIEVVNMPGDVLEGRDAQLEKALEVITERIAAGPKIRIPERPDYPDKSKPTLK